MNLITAFRNNKPHLLDVFKIEEPNTGVRIATYNVKNDTMMFYSAKTNGLIDATLTEHIRMVIGV